MTTFSNELFDVICERIAEGESLRDICLDDEMPNRSTVFVWLKNVDGCADQYVHAREAQADKLFGEILNIADCVQHDVTLDKDGKEIVNHDIIQRDRLRVDARKWMSGKLRPKVYGESSQVSLSGPDEGPIEVKSNNLDVAKAVVEVIRKGMTDAPSGDS